MALDWRSSKARSCLAWQASNWNHPTVKHWGLIRGKTEFDWRRLTRLVCDFRPQNRCRSAAAVTKVASEKSISINHLLYLSPNSAGLRRTRSMHLRIESSGLITQVVGSNPAPATKIQRCQPLAKRPLRSGRFALWPRLGRPWPASLSDADHAERPTTLAAAPVRVTLLTRRPRPPIRSRPCHGLVVASIETAPSRCDRVDEGSREKGKPVERRGRKASGLRRASAMSAGLPSTSLAARTRGASLCVKSRLERSHAPLRARRRSLRRAPAARR